MALTVDCISDDKLQHMAFTTFLKRVALLSACANVNDHVLEQQINYALQVLWELLKNSNHSFKQNIAKYIADESRLFTFALDAMCTSWESYGKGVIL